MASTNRDKSAATARTASARNWAISLEARERARSGAPAPIARAAVARRIGLMPGTFENLRRGRVKQMRLVTYEAVRAEFLRETEREIHRLEHDLALARAAGAHPGGPQWQEIATHLHLARSLIAAL